MANKLKNTLSDIWLWFVAVVFTLLGFASLVI